MLMTLVSALIGACCAAAVVVAYSLVNNWYDFWIPALLFVGFTVLTALAIIILLFISTLFIDTKKPQKGASKFYFHIYNFVNDFLVVWCGAKIKHVEKEKLGKGPYMFVINHRSNFDTMIISHYYKKYYPLMISKPSNFKIPVAGPYIYKVGFLVLPRNDNRAGLAVINRATEYLKEGEYSIGICPEGTRNKGRRDLLPFKDGCFKIAMRASAPIAVFAIDGSENIAKNFPFKRGKVYFTLLKVITPEEYAGKNTHEVGKMVHDLMYAEISSHAPINEPEVNPNQERHETVA